MFKFLLGLIKGELISRAGKFTWAASERKRLEDEGYTAAEIDTSQKIMRDGIYWWIERQVK
jgi:hypothetical protein